MVKHCAITLAWVADLALEGGMAHVKCAQQALQIVASYYPGRHHPLRHVLLLQDIEAEKRDGLFYSPMM